MPPAAPIVITLKKRLGGRYYEGSPRSSREKSPASPPRLRSPSPKREAKAAAPRSPSPKAVPREAPARDRSRSRSRSAAKTNRSTSPLPPAKHEDKDPSGKAEILNRSGLEDIFARFHGELDSYLQAETTKIERAEARGTTARERLSGSANLVCDFVRDHAPQTYMDLGADPVGEGFASRALPRFLDMADEDRRALQEATTALGAFAERRFPKNEELAALKEAESPVKLLKAILALLAPPKREAAGEEPPARRHRRRHDTHEAAVRPPSPRRGRDDVDDVDSVSPHPQRRHDDYGGAVSEEDLEMERRRAAAARTAVHLDKDSLSGSESPRPAGRPTR